MEHTRFEPFGEQVARHEDSSHRSSLSKALLWSALTIFWSIIALIVVARAAYFEPGVFVDFGRLATLARYVF